MTRPFLAQATWTPGALLRIPPAPPPGKPLTSPITVSNSIAARWEGRGPGWGCGAQISYLFILEVGCLLIIR